MAHWWKRIPLKLTLFFPIFLGIVLAILVSTLFHLRFSRITMQEQLQKSLGLEVHTIIKMFEREHVLKLNRVKTNMDVAHAVFHSRPLEIFPETITTEAVNQLTGQTNAVTLNRWTWGGSDLHFRHELVDSLRNLFGGTVTLFQRIDSGFVRISTNVMNSIGQRATGTYIPNESPVVRAIVDGNPFVGRAFVVDDWYITAYTPLVHRGEVVGMLYVGDREKDMNELRSILKGFRIGESGYVYVFDEAGSMLIHPFAEGVNWSADEPVKQILQMRGGSLNYKPDAERSHRLVAFEYFEPFRLFVAAEIEPPGEIRGLIRKTLVSSSLVGLIIIACFSVFVYYITNEKIQEFFRQLEISDKRLSSAREALKETESRFRFLFNSTTDDIFVTDLEGNFVEVNHSACQNLGYERDDLLRMNMVDIKTERYREQVRANREKIIIEGKMTYESEHLTRDGKGIPVEMKSRLIDMGESRYIVTAARNVSERKELERKILSAVIQAEEKERERFSRDMHDGLGPLLSTIKLYVNELGTEQIGPEERKNYVKYTSDLVNEAISNTRDISNNLMPRVIHDYGLVTALEAFCKKINMTSKIELNFGSKNMFEPLEKNIQLILFRVISELINNTIRHSGATRADIKLEREGEDIRLNYSDNGKGFDHGNIMDDSRTGMGLKNIISRIKSINGTYKIESEPGKGSVFKIEVPV